MDKRNIIEWHPAFEASIRLNLKMKLKNDI